MPDLTKINCLTSRFKLKKIEKKTNDSFQEDVRKKIRVALNNKQYSMRSLDGIAKETHLSEKQLSQAITQDKVLAKEIKFMPFRSKDGQLLLMSKERFIKEASFKVKFIDFFATNRQGVKNA